MINADALSTLECGLDEPGAPFCLRKNIAAIQVLPSSANEEPKIGMITQLPAGAELHTCGVGFNERTIKVRWAGGLYFVFLQDLESPAVHYATV